MIIRLSWPPSELNPNKRLHWATKAKFVKKYRNLVFWECKDQRVPTGLIGPIKMKVVFYPPTRAKRDKDNLVAAFKSGQDGLSDALGVDDSGFFVSHELSKETGGYVTVEILED